MAMILIYFVIIDTLEGPSSSNDRHQCAYDVLMASEYRRNSYISDFAPYNYYIKHKQQ